MCPFRCRVFILQQERQRRKKERLNGDIKLTGKGKEIQFSQQVTEGEQDSEKWRRKNLEDDK